MTAAWPVPGAGEPYALTCDRGRSARLLVVPALFDEAAKLRRLAIETMAALDRAGIDSVLPDLPGTNESLAPLETLDLDAWRAAMATTAAQFGATRVLALRGGALVAPELPGWAYAPVKGATLLHSLLRARIIAGKEAGEVETREGLMELGLAEGLDLAGYRLCAALIAGLEGAEPRPGLAPIAPADLGGPPLHLRAEPGHDPAQAKALARLLVEATGPDEPSPLQGRGLGEGNERNPSTGGPRPPAPSPKGEGEVRRHLTFACGGETIVGTLDAAPGATGLLVVSGGNDPRCGAFGWQARLAGEVSAAGHPVFRFDRRGVGDGQGENGGFQSSAPDLAAALATFREAAPQVTRVVALGNCDAASALMLAGGAEFDGLVLANPWTLEHDAGEPAPAAIRARYAARLKDPQEWRRLLTGGVDLAKLARGLVRAAAPKAPPPTLATEIAAGLARFAGPVAILIAGRDRTAQAFLEHWDAADPRLALCPTASHAFAEPEARDWLLERVLASLDEGK